MISVGGVLIAASSITINFGKSLSKPSDSILIVLGITVLTLAPSLLILLTGFVRVVIVLGLTQNALGLQQIIPAQALAGLALFLSLFIMAPTLSQMNNVGLQPYLHGKESFSQAYDAAQVPLKHWMLKQTGKDELALTSSVAKENPANPMAMSLSAIIPAFLLTQLKVGFIIGFVLLLPFLVINLVVASALMSMGIMLLPPTLVALPFNLLLFVMVDGWVLLTKALVVSFR